MVPRRLIAPLALLALPGLAGAVSLDAVVGKALFERNWVSAPSSTKSNDGLGPLYDAPSCASCHVSQRSPDFDETTIPPGTIVRLGNARGSGDPVYGLQLQTRGVAGQVPEANPDIEWMVANGKREATITLYRQGYGALAPDTKMALRRASVLNGASLLAQVPESEILKQAESERMRGDGIAGAPAWLMRGGKRVLGRLGWKATEPDVPAQISAAFSRDIGLSTTAHPEPWGDCTPSQAACRAGPHGAEAGEVEIADPLVQAIADYLAQLSKPAPRASREGIALFESTGCSACHATLQLGDGSAVAAYSDLLLHQMGEGLNDGIAEGAAGPGQWRTAPLWNTAKSLELGGLLHDGRARTVAEAIDWHGGEAAAARARFLALAPRDREALAAFVGGL